MTGKEKGDLLIQVTA